MFFFSIFGFFPKNFSFHDFCHCSEKDDQDDRKTRFTAYSMSSSIMRRSVKLENLDDHFEEFFAKFDDEEIGDLPQKNLADNEIELDSELLKNMIQQDYDEFVPKVFFNLFYYFFLSNTWLHLLG